MGAALDLQAAIVAKLSQASALSGVFNDAPARASFPYLVVGCSDEKDWSCVGRSGREIVVECALWDDQPSRLLFLEDLIERDVQDLYLSAGWSLTSFLLLGKKRLRDAAGPWACSLRYRARMMSAPADAAL